MGKQRHPFAEQVMKMKLQAPPAPWEYDGWGVAGLTEVGYAPDSDYLLAISENRGVFDCSWDVKTRKVARDYDTDGWFDVWRDARNLTAIGIGPVADQVIRLAGLWGGGLNHTSSDGWRLEKVSPNWPLSSIILCPPNCHLFHRGSEQCVKVAPRGEEDEILAYGFSRRARASSWQ